MFYDFIFGAYICNYYFTFWYIIILVQLNKKAYNNINKSGSWISKRKGDITEKIEDNKRQKSR